MSSWTGSGVDSQEVEVVYTCEKCSHLNDTIAYETRWRDKAVAECEMCGAEKDFYPEEEDYKVAE
jgi:transcription elongation factor Elf1